MLRPSGRRSGASRKHTLAKRDIIGIGGSAGGGAALKAILQRVPADLPATVFVTLHIPSRGGPYLAQALAQVSALAVETPEDGTEIQPGRVYVAPPDRHLLAHEGRVALGSGPRENMTRPSVDPMLRSLALAYGGRAIGVILSGSLNDGASGLYAVKQCGGLALVQDPDDAQVADMPRAALETVEPDRVATAEALASVLATLAGSEPHPPVPCPRDVALEVEIAAGRRLGHNALREFADPVALTCPNCHGVVSEYREGRPLRYRCQVGHALSAEVLLKEHDPAVEEALRSALRIMEERAELVDRMARDARQRGRTAVAELYEARSQEYESHVRALRSAVMAGLGFPEDG